MKTIFFSIIFTVIVGVTNVLSQTKSIVFKTLDNKQISLNELAVRSNEKPVILYTWVKVCKPCIESLDHINKSYHKLKSLNFEFFSINIDKYNLENTNRSYFQFKTELEFLKFLKEKNWSFETIYDSTGSYIKNILNDKAGVPQLWVFYNNKLYQYENAYLTLPEFYDDYISDVITSFEVPVDRTLYYPSSSGQKQVLQIYSLKNGLRTGTWKAYFRDLKQNIVTSQLEYVKQYNDYGQLHGKWIKYYKTGITKEIIFYSNGKLVGEYSYFYDNGKLWYKGQYYDGEKNGLWLEYDENGNIIKQNNFTAKKSRTSSVSEKEADSTSLVIKDKVLKESKLNIQIYNLETETVQKNLKIDQATDSIGIKLELLFPDRISVNSYNFISKFEFNDFKFKNIPITNYTIDRTTYKEQNLISVILKNGVLFPEKRGLLYIEPIEIEIDASIPTNKKDFLGSSIYKKATFRIKSELKEIKY